MIIHKNLQKRGKGKMLGRHYMWFERRLYPPDRVGWWLATIISVMFRLKYLQISGGNLEWNATREKPRRFWEPS